MSARGWLQRQPRRPPHRAPARCVVADRAHCAEPVYLQGRCLEHWLWLCAHPEAKPSRREWVAAEMQRILRGGGQ